MLKHLSIENYALIDHLSIDFFNGFSAITGETGAGKSIILGALGLILGQRADTKVLAEGENKCVVEAEFSISSYGLEPLFSQYEWDYDPECCLVRREILSSGKSRAFVNDTPVTLQQIKELTEKLIDVHSQHQNLLLSDETFQIRTVDAFAVDKELLKEYRSLYHCYSIAQKELEELGRQVAASLQEEDYIRFQYERLTEASLQEDEQIQLEEEREILMHAEEIGTTIARSDAMMNEEATGILIQLKQILQAIGKTAPFCPPLEMLSQRLYSVEIETKDIAQELSRIGSEIEINPPRLEQILQRLDLIYSLEKKYQADSVAELLALARKWEKELSLMEHACEELEQKKQEVRQLESELYQKASILSLQRQEGIPSLVERMRVILAALGIPSVKIEVEIITGQTLSPLGTDHLKLLFSANKNVPVQPIASIASGGEMARVMFTIKSLLSESESLPTILFDEVDTGVSGEIAHKMASLMKQMGQRMQVITITHLPQIAAKGESHYKVFKDNSQERTRTDIIQLTDHERITEIAGMVSGSTLTQAALDHAKELLEIE